MLFLGFDFLRIFFIVFPLTCFFEKSGKVFMSLSSGRQSGRFELTLNPPLDLRTSMSLKNYTYC